MNNMTEFTHGEFGKLGVVEIEGRLYFPAKRCAEMLGYTNTRKAIGDHCNGVTKRYLTDSLGREQETNLIPEGDLYRLIARSKLPTAEKFERWVFDEVLPSIRKSGGYGSNCGQAGNRGQAANAGQPIDREDLAFIISQTAAETVKAVFGAARGSADVGEVVYSDENEIRRVLKPKVLQKTDDIVNDG